MRFLGVGRNMAKHVTLRLLITRFGVRVPVGSPDYPTRAMAAMGVEGKTVAFSDTAFGGFLAIDGQE
jgi:hypothetical protein